MVSFFSENECINTFGYHPFHRSESLNLIHRCSRWEQLLGRINEIASLALAAAAAIIMRNWAVIPMVGGAVFAGLITLQKVIQLVRRREVCQTAGILFDRQAAFQYQVPKECQPVEGVVTEHCADTEWWRKELVASAEHHIVISGNYCGGMSFQALLDAIVRRLKQKPSLKVVILSSPLCLDRVSLDKIDALTQAYPRNFSLIKSPDILHLSPGVKKTTNHTKCVLVDYGKYFILGGSNIQDVSAGTGLENLSFEKFLDAKSHLDAKENVQTDPEERSNQSQQAWFLKALPMEYRDMDFVFSSRRNTCLGRHVYRQLLLLAYRWEQYEKLERGDVFTSPLKAEELGVLTGKQVPLSSKDTLTEQMLKTPIPAWNEISTRVPSFDRSQEKVSKVQFRLLASGPEQTGSLLAVELVSQFDRAKQQITINHMYFHPSQEIMDALVRAIKRGVEVTVITCGIFDKGPIIHKGFGPRNKLHYTDLSRALSAEERRRLKVYEFQQENRGSHKKVIVIDDTVVAGNSNLGYKSLVATSDHELNFVCTSSDFSKKTLEVCAVDITHSQAIDHTIPPTVQDEIRAQLHKLVAPLMG